MIVGSEEMETGVYHVADDEALSTKEIIHIIQRVTGRKTINLALPKALVQFVARLGDRIPIPLNTKRLKKLTGNLLLSNAKIKSALAITKLPCSAEEGLEKTIRSFNVNSKHQ
jgi:nucleoside-diphosphate-sugar epimerase